MSEHHPYLKRLSVAIEVNDRANRLRDDEIRNAVQHHVPPAVVAEHCGLSTEQVTAIAAADIAALLPPRTT